MDREARVAYEHRYGSFDPELVETHSVDRRGGTLFNGYFQNEGYFLHAAGDIADSFAPPPAAAVDFLDRLDARLGTPGADTVAVSIRAGGDYQALGWAIEPQWYHHAAATIADRVGAARFVVVSDVPAAADATAARLADLGPAISAAHLDAAAQLHVMAALDHAVVAPSSFAWWGAWCGDYRTAFDPARIVVAPKPWVHERFDQTPSHRWWRLPARAAARSLHASALSKTSSTDWECSLRRLEISLFRGHRSAWPVWAGREDGVHVQAGVLPSAGSGRVSS
jgi:hypothetical protein